MRLVAAPLIAVSFALLAGSGAGASSHPLLAVGYDSAPALRAAVGGRAGVVRLFPRIHVAEVRAGAPLRVSRGIRYVEPVHARVSAAEPALLSPFPAGTPYEWQY